MRTTIKSVALAAIAALFALTSCNNDLKADIEALQAEQELQNFESGDNQVASLETQIEAMKAASDMYSKEVAPKLSTIGDWLNDSADKLIEANAALDNAVKTKTTAAEFLAAVTAFKTVADKAMTDGQELAGPEDFALETLCFQLAAYKDAIDTFSKADKSAAEKNAQAKAYAAAAVAAGKTAITTIKKHAADNAEAIAALTDKVIPALQARVKATLDAIDQINKTLEGKPTAAAIETANDIFNKTTNANVMAMEDVLLGALKGRMDATGFTNFKNAYLDRFEGYEAWKIYVDATLAKHASEIAQLRADLEEEVAALQGQIDDLFDYCDEIVEFVDFIWEILQDQIDVIDEQIEAIELDLEGVHVEIDKINGEIEKLWKAVNLLNADKNTEGSVKYYVEQLRINLQAQIDALAARVTINEAEIRALKARVQSLVFVPQYADMKFGIPFSVIKADDTHTQYEAYNDPENGFAVKYKVAPFDLAKPLAEAVNASIAAQLPPLFTFDITDLALTRASATPGPELHILKATGDDKTGIITFQLKHENFYGDKVGHGQHAISLRIDDEGADAEVSDVKKGIHVASEYVQTIVQPSSQIDIDMAYVYKAKADGTGVDLDSRIKLKNDNAATDTDFEVSRALPYTTKDTFAPYKDYELAATITTGGLKTGPFTYAQLREKGYNMPVVGVTVEEKTSVCSYLVLEGTGTASTVKVDNTSMKEVKTHHNDSATPAWGESHTLGLNYAFDTGLGIDLNMQALIAIVKTDLVLGFNFPYAFTWTYAADKGKDHTNRPYGSYSHAADYTRAWNGTPSFTVTPVLASVNGTALTTPLELDGSNAVYGLEPSDFNGKAFTKVSTPSNFDVDMDISTGHVDDANKTLSPDGVTVKAKLGGTYSGTGKYTLDLAATAVNVNYTITTTDRKTDEIIITAPATDHVPAGVTATTTTASLNRKGVQLLTNLNTLHYTDGEKWCHQNCNVYSVASGDIAPAMYDAFKSQGIFTASDYASATAALAQEFDGTYIYPNNSNNMSSFGGKKYNFVLNEDGTGITLRSNTVANYYGKTHADDPSLPTNNYVYEYGFKSSSLKDMAQSYPDKAEVDYSAEAYTQRFLSYSFYTYVGQKVTLYWSFTAEAPESKQYSLKTNHPLTYDSVKNYWYYNVAPTYQYQSDTDNKSYVNHLFTFMNMQEQVGVHNGTAFILNNDAAYTNEHVFPEFKVTSTDAKVTMTAIPGATPYVNSNHGASPTTVATESNANILKYYGQLEDVKVTADLYLDSDGVKFPLTHKIVDGASKLDAIYVKQYNPFRDNQDLHVDYGTVSRGQTFVLPLTMVDKLGNRIFNLGNMENPFSNNGIAGIKSSIKAVYGNDINVTLTDDDDPNALWTLSISDDVPPQIKVSIPATATLGEHTLQVRFVSQWKNYDYTFKVNVQ